MARRRIVGRAATFAVCVLAGSMISASALAARGFDLRPDRNGDVVALVVDARDRHDALTARAAALRDGIDALTRGQAPARPEADEATRLAAGTVAVHGPAVVVTLTDAPLDVKPQGVDEDLLVVHQQDIQAVLNVLWSAGAEAATVQGRRVGPGTGIKCVGNTVILDGVPYAPPYVIAGIGDVDAMQRALGESGYLKAYRKVADLYGLGWAVETRDDVDMPAWSSPAELTHARVK